MVPTMRLWVRCDAWFCSMILSSIFSNIVLIIFSWSASCTSRLWNRSSISSDNHKTQFLFLQHNLKLWKLTFNCSLSIFYTNFLNIKTCSKVTQFCREINVTTLQLGDHKFCAQFPLIHIYSILSLFTTASHWHLLSVVKSGTMFHTKELWANFHITGNIWRMLPLSIAQQWYAIYIYIYIWGTINAIFF
jgi:hypothetical protein